MQIEVRPQEVASSLEGWRRWLFAMVLIAILAIASGDRVEAQDGDDLYLDNSPITLVIPDGAIVREDRGYSASAEIGDFPTGEAAVVGWFIPEAGNRPFGAHGEGVWAVVRGSNDEVGTLHLGGEDTGLDINQNDGTDITQDELVAAGIPQFTVDAPTFGVQPIRPEQPTAEPTETPAIPEVPAQFSVKTMEFVGNSFQMVENTVETNQDQIMPLPFGIVDLSRYPELQAVADQIEASLGVGDREHTYQFRVLAVHGIFVKGTQTAGGNGDWHLHVALPTSRGEWTAFSTADIVQQNVFTIPLDGDLKPVDQSGQLTFVSTQTRYSSDNLMVSPNPIESGDSAVFFVYFPEPEQETSVTGIQRNSCGGRETDEAIEYIMGGGQCQLSNGTNTTPYLILGAIASPNQ